MKNLLIKNIARLVTMQSMAIGEGELGVIENASILIEDSTIKWFGKTKDFRTQKKLYQYDATGLVITPGLIDCHTHLVHAGTRQNEFDLRCQGKSYWEIANDGGGIISTVRATRKVSQNRLFDISIGRATEALIHGTLTMEVKTGYGLDTNTEVKILKTINRIDKMHPITLIGTFLGAHAVPEEFKNKRSKYIKIITEEMLPKVSKFSICKYCDIFVEEGAFTPDEARLIASAAKSHNLGIRLHVDQFKSGSGAELAAQLNAKSADHLEFISDRGIAALRDANVVAVLLPGACFFTSQKKYPPARKMIDMGVTVAIATDYNPGTNPCLDLLMTGTIASTQMGMTLNEVWKAITINAAKSLGIENILGSIAVGKKADLVIFDAPDEYFPLYRYGKNCVKAVVKNGSILTIK